MGYWRLVISTCLLAACELALADVVIDQSIHRSAAFLAQGNAVTAQVYSPDILYVNPANLAVFMAERNAELQASLDSLNAFHTNLRQCISTLKKFKYKENQAAKNERLRDHLCAHKLAGQYKKAALLLKKLGYWKVDEAKGNCLSAKVFTAKNGYCLERLQGFTTALEKKIASRSLLTYALNIDMSDLGSELLQINDDEKRALRAADRRGEPAAAWLGHSATYATENWAVSFLQSQSLFAIAQFDAESQVSAEEKTSTNDGLLLLIADYAKSNVLTTSFYRGFPNFAIGYNFHFYHREVAKFKEALSNVETIKQAKNMRRTTTGSAVGADLGLSYRLAPSFYAGASLLQVGDVAIRRKFIAGDALETLGQEIRTGLSYRHSMDALALDLSLDFSDPSNQSNFSILRRVSMGTKLCYKAFLCFAGGLLEGYLSSGMSLEGDKFNIHFTAYSREKSPTVLGSIPEQHVNLQLGARIRHIYVERIGQ